MWGTAEGSGAIPAPLILPTGAYGMRVLIFGASLSAKYPAATSLIPTVSQFVSEYSDDSLSKSWGIWDSWCNGSGAPKGIALNPNPEVVLSLVDLYEAARQGADLDAISTVLRRLRSESLTDVDLEKYERLLKDPSRHALVRAEVARTHFLECLQRYFFHCHHRDAGNPKDRDYLRNHFRRFSNGDILITLNWDASAERTLAEERLWNPLTGYGFSKDLKSGPLGESLLPIQDPSSPVFVLKLHGSIEWSASASGGINYDNARYLQDFDFRYDNIKLYLHDPGSPGWAASRANVALSVIFETFEQRDDAAYLAPGKRESSHCRAGRNLRLQPA